jgi:hypothetical protein
MEEQKQETKPSMVMDAHMAADRLEKANAEMRANIAKMEELKAFERLGGVTEGRPQETKPVEISPKEYAKMVLEGKLPLN